MATGRSLNRFGIFADFPIQVNALDHAQPLNVMTNQQQTDTLCDLERRGNVTSDALQFVATAPITFVIQVNFKFMHLGKLPLPNICAATTDLCDALQTAQVP